jgi:hypothetical protein
MLYRKHNLEGSTVKRLLLVGFAVALASCEIFAGSQTANAASASSIDYSIDGGVTWHNIASAAADGTSQGADITVNGVTISGANLTSNASVGSPTLSKIQTATGNLSFATGGTHEVLLAFGTTGFTSPLAPPNEVETTSLSGTVTTGSPSNLLSIKSWADSGNNLRTANVALTNPDPAVGSLAANDTTAPLIPGVSATVVITSLTSPFAIDELLDVTMGSGSSVNFSAQTNVFTPEPSSIVLLGCGAVGMVGYGWKRRKVTA